MFFNPPITTNIEYQTSDTLKDDFEYLMRCDSTNLSRLVGIYIRTGNEWTESLRRRVFKQIIEKCNPSEEYLYMIFKDCVQCCPSGRCCPSSGSDCIYINQALDCVRFARRNFSETDFIRKIKNDFSGWWQIKRIF